MRVSLGLVLVCLLCLFALTGDARQGSVRVTVTAYCDGTVTAAGTRPRPGIIALSRDVERLLGVQFGDHVRLEGVGEYVFLDRMPWYWYRRVDIYVPPRAKALEFGIRHYVTLSVPGRLAEAPAPGL